MRYIKDLNGKSVYIFSDREIKMIIENYNQKKMIEVDNKEYYYIDCDKDVKISKETFEEALKSSAYLKDAIKKLNITQFKFYKLAIKHYGVKKFEELKQIVNCN